MDSSEWHRLTVVCQDYRYNGRSNLLSLIWEILRYLWDLATRIPAEGSASPDHHRLPTWNDLCSEIWDESSSLILAIPRYVVRLTSRDGAKGSNEKSSQHDGNRWVKLKACIRNLSEIRTGIQEAKKKWSDGAQAASTSPGPAGSNSAACQDDDFLLYLVSFES